MLTSTIITKFELQVSDITELSSQEELDLANLKYQEICSDRQWEMLKTEATGTMTLDATTGLYYITMPSDFSMFAINNQTTDNSDSINNDSQPSVIFVGTDYQPYQIVNFSDRRQYRNRAGYCYLDYANAKIWFTYTPVAFTYSFDYIKVPATLTLSTSPVIPDRFCDIIYLAMAIDNDVIQKSDKAKSYLKENAALYSKRLLDMQFWNANLQMN